MRSQENADNTEGKGLHRISRWIAGHELLILVLLSPLFLVVPQMGPVGAVLALSMWACRWRASGRLTSRTPLDGLVALLLCAGILALVPSVDLQRSLAAFWKLVFGILIYYGVVNAFKDGASLRRVAVTVVLGCLGLTLLCLVATDWSNARLIAFPIYDYMPRLMTLVWASEVFNPRATALTLATLLPLVLAYACVKGDKRFRLLASATALLMAATVLLSQSPQGLVGLAAALFCLAALWRWQTLLLLPAGAGAAAIWLASIGTPRLADMLFSLDDYLGFGVALRLDMWSRALDMLRDMPYTGIGLDTFPHMIWDFYPGFALGPEPHSHNLYLQVALDLGLPGLVVFLGIVGIWLWWTLKAYARASDSHVRAVLAGSAAGVIAFLAHGFVDTIWATKPIVFVWPLLALGMVASKPTWAASAPAAKHFKITAQTALGIALAAALVVSVLVAPGLLVRNIGVLRAHRILSQVEASSSPAAGNLAPVRTQLERISQSPQGDSHVFNLLGRADAWLQDYNQAILAFRQEVTLDEAEDPLSHYAPQEGLRARLVGAPPMDAADALVKVYSAWMTRFPDRAEAYLRVAMVWAELKGDREKALTVVQRGIDADAVPHGLLERYRATLE